jgi:RNA polymerase sigma-70 factor, ECF subfamily
MIVRTETTMTQSPAVRARLDLEAAIASHRPELTRYCRRILGSPVDAEDAVQETLLRAWRSADGLQEPAAFRSWLYRIAGNVCIDSVNLRARQPIPTDDCREPLYHAAAVDPAELVLTHEELRLALTAAVHRLPPRQRAVLLLREILCWRAAEVADFLATSVAAVNSALQRAHATLNSCEPERLTAADMHSRRGLVMRYLTAFEADDVEALAALSRSDRAANAFAS